MVDSPITWLVRSIHVFGAAVWLGGYVVMLLAVIPYLARERNESVRAIALATARHQYRWGAHCDCRPGHD